MTILNVVESAYRGTLEEQDDTVLWLSQALKGAGAELAVLLRGNAVNYLVRAQDASGLAFGEKRQAHPAALADDLVRMISKGIAVYFVSEDALDRGLAHAEMIAGATGVSRGALPELFSSHDRVWQW
jgi:hypothetical protein